MQTTISVKTLTAVLSQYSHLMAIPCVDTNPYALVEEIVKRLKTK